MSRYASTVVIERADGSAATYRQETGDLGRAIDLSQREHLAANGVEGTVLLAELEGRAGRASAPADRRAWLERDAALSRAEEVVDRWVELHPLEPYRIATGFAVGTTVTPAEQRSQLATYVADWLLADG